MAVKAIVVVKAVKAAKAAKAVISFRSLLMGVCLILS